jgi:hypothetical protein
MTSEQRGQLIELAGVLNREATACARDKHWRAAVILVAESVEAALLAMVSWRETELRGELVWPTGKQADRPPEDWMFGTLLDVAERAGWLVPTLSKDTGPADQLLGEAGDAVRSLKAVRNLAVHPGRVVMKGQLSELDLTDGPLMAQLFPVLDGIAGAVFERLNAVVMTFPDPPSPPRADPTTEEGPI